MFMQECRLEVDRGLAEQLRRLRGASNWGLLKPALVEADGSVVGPALGFSLFLNSISFYHFSTFALCFRIWEGLLSNFCCPYLVERVFRDFLPFMLLWYRGFIGKDLESVACDVREWGMGI